VAGCAPGEEFLGSKFFVQDFPGMGFQDLDGDDAMRDVFTVSKLVAEKQTNFEVSR
jgi:hypothetical protein